MTQAAPEQYRHVGETKPIEDHDHDLVHALSDRLDSVWRADQYIANAEGKEDLKDFWRQIKERDLKTVRELRGRIKQEVGEDCF